MRNIYLTIMITAIVAGSLHAQMIDAGDTLYGNEWIDYSQTYYKVKVAEDGIYRISGATLQQAGMPIENIQPGQYQLFWMGKEQPVYISSKSSLGAEDYIEFYGKKNRSELDRYLFENPQEEMLNPAYSMHTDTAVYFLSWSETGSGLRYLNLENNISEPLPPSAPWYWHTEEFVFTENHFKPTISSDGVRYSTYVEGEGFCSRALVSQSFTINASNIYTDGPAAKLSYRISGRLMNHDCTVDLNGQNIATYITSPSQLIIDEKSIVTTDLMAGNKIDLISQLPNDRLVVGQAALQYPRAFPLISASGMHLTLPVDTIERTVSLTEDGSSTSFVIYDLEQQTRLVVAGSEAIIPAGMTQLYIAEVGSIATLKISAAAFEPLVHSDASYVFITSKKFLTEPSNHLADYVAYRSSDAGGNYKVLTLFAEDLYDQFAYGVNYHPLSVKNWSNFAVQQFPDLEFVYLVGKGFHYSDVRKEADKGFLPVYGLPGSDNLLLSKGSSAVPNFATGHLAALSQEDIKIYLDKITVMEDLIANAPQTMEDRLWMKRVLHLSGGSREGNERLLLQEHLETMGKKLEENKFGALVTSLSKQTNDIIDKNINEDIVGLINDGIMIKTYFGHGGTTITELDAFEHPKFFNNKDRYPVMISLGCHTGDIFTPVISLSEENIINTDRGAIVYLATSGLGYISSLNTFGNDFYDLIGNDFYIQPLGNSIRQVIKNQDESSSVGNKTLIQQLIFHGDPALKLRLEDGPDFLVDEQSFRTEPTTITSSDDSIIVCFDVMNVGSSIQDSIVISIVHSAGGNEVNRIFKKIAAPTLEGRVCTPLEISISGISGNNEIVVHLDPDNSIQELPDPSAELNNFSKQYEFFIQDDALIPVYPQNYGIVGDPEITIQVTTSNGFAPQRTYLFEIDTTKLFDSPLKEAALVEGNYSIEWTPVLELMEDMVYYWRVSAQTDNPDEHTWTNRSFIYLPGQSGWNQSHLYQFQENDFEGMRYEGNSLIYDSTGFFISIHNKLYDPLDRPGYQFNFETFAASVNPWVFMTEGIAIVVANPTDGAAWTNNGGDFGSINTTSFASFRTFGFPTKTKTQRDTIVHFLNNVVPDDHFVFLFTILRSTDSELKETEWVNDIIPILKSQGSTKIDAILTSGPVPYNIIYVKNKKIIAEDIGEKITDYIKSDGFIGIPNSTGRMISKIIGPGQNWNSFNWQNTITEKEHSFVRIFGLGKNLTPLDSLTSLGIISLSSEKYKTFDYFKLEYQIEDNVDKTPEQLIQWRMIFEELPDYLFSNISTFHADTLEEGEELTFQTTLRRISKSNPPENVAIRYQITSELNEKVEFVDTLNFANSIEQIDVTFKNSENLYPGNNQFKVELNPPVSKPEIVHSNNFFIANFYVRPDIIDPVLEVTFDGRQIQNNEVISPAPEIILALTDENKNQLLTETTLFNISITDPNGNIRNLSETDPDMEFIPATSFDLNTAYFVFRPIFEIEGIYTLTAIAKDVGGNIAGGTSYSISFEIQFENEVIDFSISPNPFNLFTNIKFSLTGNILPSVVNFNIYSMDGKLIKQFRLDQFDGLHIGNNQFEIQWNGMDQQGNFLAAGIYAYELEIMDSEGLEIPTIDEKKQGKLILAH